MTTDTQASPGVQYLEIDPERAGQRLDNFLITELKGVPKSRIYQLLRKGEVRINKGRKRPEYRLQPGDVVRLPPIRRAAPSNPTQKKLDLPWLASAILYEDDHLIAINKPSGLAVHGGSGIQLGLIEALRQMRPGSRFLELVHRLDRATSGCLLIARRRATLLALHEQLRAGQMDKRYLALVRGVWQGGARHIEAPLQKNLLRSGEREVRVTEAGKPAASRFSPRQSFAEATLMEIQLLTGRTHQARVHAAHSGHPIAGDEKYGDPHFDQRMRARGLKRLFLHAASLTFWHPAKDCKIRLEAPLPPELTAILDDLTHDEKV